MQASRQSRVLIFENTSCVFLVQSKRELSAKEVDSLEWLFEAKYKPKTSITGSFVGPKVQMLSPWSTNASDIVRNMGLVGITRIELFSKVEGKHAAIDHILEAFYSELSAKILSDFGEAKEVFEVVDIGEFNDKFGLALSQDELEYLEGAKASLKRNFTDSELFGFAQINSEHCRHKIFNGSFTVDGIVQDKSLFALIKDTSKAAPQNIVSAYVDNVAFLKGPNILQFAPSKIIEPGIYGLNQISSVISLKAETHNFPTTVEPFYGASTGTGGEIRDRMAGGMGSIPLAGSAVYMTALTRLNSELSYKCLPRNWKYQSPAEILIKASNGASDFGNKFGQPLIVGSILTFECQTNRAMYAYDRAVMLAGGVGYTNALFAEKRKAKPGDLLVVMGGDNYRIGMAGGSVSSVTSGAYASELELSAIQRANPEMQKRVFNAIRALVEHYYNPVKLIHDHGAGGHINCFSELLDPLGGKVEISKLPIGDPTLSVREILCNESQERMGLIVDKDSMDLVQRVGARERAPLYVVGEVSGTKSIEFVAGDGTKPVELPLGLLFGSSPKIELSDCSIGLETREFEFAPASDAELMSALYKVLSLESVACKDWLTNKVDRCVTGRVAMQQCCGPLGLPLNDLGVVALDYSSPYGVASALGHAPIVGIIDERAGSVLSIAEALTNIGFAPLSEGLDSVALSANWMWPARRPGEDVRLYRAVEAASEFAIALGVPIPTGKDSLSMTIRYDDGLEVRAPGTVVISAVAQVSDIRACVTADLKECAGSKLIYVNFSNLTDNPLGGSALAQSMGELGSSVPTVGDVRAFKGAFNCLQSLIKVGHILAGHDVSSGGLVVALCEMAFGGNCGIDVVIDKTDALKFLFCEKPGVIIQVAGRDEASVMEKFGAEGVEAFLLGEPSVEKTISIRAASLSIEVSTDELLSQWFKASYRLDALQTVPEMAKSRFSNVAKTPLKFSFPKGFSGKAKTYGINLERELRSELVAAVVREQGTNGEREMAYGLFAAGFDVRDVAMSDLIEGRETLEDVRFVIFPGGFSNSDVLGAAKGWAGSFRYNERAYNALRRFYEREDTLSLGVCNGCQLMVGLDLICPEHSKKMQMRHNKSAKFECSFVAVDVAEGTSSVILKPLLGSRLGVWVAHGEGRFYLPEGEDCYDIAMKYVTADYPANPNGSDFNAAAVVSKDGRHLAMMPHAERSLFPWNWAHYSFEDRRRHEISPWLLLFTSARDWLRRSVD